MQSHPTTQPHSEQEIILFCRMLRARKTFASPMFSLMLYVQTCLPHYSIGKKRDQGTSAHVHCYMCSVEKFAGWA